jgi:hypothetical protein
VRVIQLFQAACKTTLLEVMIGGERLGNPSPRHDDHTGTIDQAPLLVGSFGQQTPCFVVQCGIDVEFVVTSRSPVAYHCRILLTASWLNGSLRTK